MNEPLPGQLTAGVLRDALAAADPNALVAFVDNENEGHVDIYRVLAGPVEVAGQVVKLRRWSETPRGGGHDSR